MTKKFQKFEDCPEWKNLDALEGEWEGEGRSFGPDAKAGTRVWASDRFDWAADGNKLIHHWHWKIEGQPDFDGAEVISFDAEAGTVSARMDDSADHHMSYTLTVDPDGTLVYSGQSQRARLTMSPEGNALTSEWEFLAGGKAWQPLCGLRWVRSAAEKQERAAG